MRVYKGPRIITILFLGVPQWCDLYPSQFLIASFCDNAILGCVCVCLCVYVCVISFTKVLIL